MSSKLREIEIGTAAEKHFKNLGFDVYNEVDCDRRGIDMVLLKDDLTYAFELKTSLNLQVIYQASLNLEYANFSSIIVPSRKFDSIFYFCKDFLRDMGIGFYTYKAFSINETIQEIVSPNKNENPKGLRLFHEHKNDNIAGSPNGSRFTPFKETCENVVSFLESNDGCTIGQLVQGIKHHYNTPASAKSALIKRINQGVVNGVKIDNGKIYKITT